MMYRLLEESTKYFSKIKMVKTTTRNSKYYSNNDTRLLVVKCKTLFLLYYIVHNAVI